MTGSETPIEIIKGLRYATADRFGLPQPFDGDLDRTDTGAYGPQCPQLIGMMEQMLGQGSLPSDEDCFFLNVFTPGRDDAARPVMVWVHGGAFTNGTGATPWYHGEALARLHDVVVVTINYRLGAFGFAHLFDHASGNPAFADSGNLGIIDQVEALRWVQRNISRFGGDPSNVTIFGESAGGSSVLALMATPLGAGLFHRVIALSPSMNQLRTRARAHEATGHLLDAAGVSASALRTLPVDAVLDAQNSVLGRPGSFTAFSPTPGEPSMPLPVHEAAALNPVPLLIGTTRDEMLLFTVADPAFANMDEDGLFRYATDRFGDRAAEAIEAYREHRPGSNPGAIASAVVTDEGFRAPARRLAEARVRNGHPTWMHWFTWETPQFGGLLRSCHALDIPFVFHNLGRSGVEAFTGTGEDRAAIADFFSGAVTSFARSGNPGWDRYDLARRTTMQIDREPRTVDDPEPALRSLWDRAS
jgi:para-nitrobenzyl esterase